MQGSAERVHEDARVAVVVVERKPGRGAIDRLHPLGQQRRLAKAGRSAHQRDVAAKPGVQALEEVSPGDHDTAAPRSGDFCAPEGGGRADRGRGFGY